MEVQNVDKDFVADAAIVAPVGVDTVITIDPTNEDRPLAGTRTKNLFAFDFAFRTVSFSAEKPDEIVTFALDRDLLKNDPTVSAFAEAYAFWRFVDLKLILIPTENFTNVSGEMTVGFCPLPGLGWPASVAECEKFSNAFPGMKHYVGAKQERVFDLSRASQDPQKKGNWFCNIVSQKGTRPVYDTAATSVAMWGSVTPSTGNFFRFSLKLIGSIEGYTLKPSGITNHVSTGAFKFQILNDAALAEGKTMSFTTQLPPGTPAVVGTLQTYQPIDLLVELTSAPVLATSKALSVKHIVRLDTASIVVQEDGLKAVVNTTLDLGNRVPFTSIASLKFVDFDNRIKGKDFLAAIVYQLKELAAWQMLPVVNMSQTPWQRYQMAANVLKVPSSILQPLVDKACQAPSPLL